MRVLKLRLSRARRAHKKKSRKRSLYGQCSGWPSTRLFISAYLILTHSRIFNYTLGLSPMPKSDRGSRVQRGRILKSLSFRREARTFNRIFAIIVCHSLYIIYSILALPPGSRALPDHSVFHATCAPVLTSTAEIQRKSCSTNNTLNKVQQDKKVASRDENATIKQCQHLVSNTNATPH